MGFFTKKGHISSGDKHNVIEPQKHTRQFLDDFNWRANAERNLSTKRKKRSKAIGRAIHENAERRPLHENAERRPLHQKVERKSGTGATSVEPSLEEKQRLYRDVLYSLGNKHVGKTRGGRIDTITDIYSSNTPSSPLKIVSRHDDERVLLPICPAAMSEGKGLKRDETEQAWSSELDLLSSCFMLDALSWYEEIFCADEHNSKRQSKSTEKVVLECDPYVIPREISFSKMNDESQRGDYRVLECMEELDPRNPSFLESLVLRRKRTYRDGVRVFVDKPKPAKVSSTVSVYSALTTPSELNSR
jgi:hypothetical protein